MPNRFAALIPGVESLPIGLPACFSAAALLCACTINSIDIPENPCSAPLREREWPHPVDFEQPAAGQVSVFIRFSSSGDNLVYARDTLLASVGDEAERIFAYAEHVCVENYLSPYQPYSYSSILQRQDGSVRTMGYTELLPYDGITGLELHPQGPLLDFQGLRPPDGVEIPSYGRIVGFTLGGRVFDTVSVYLARYLNLQELQYWIYSASEGPLVSARIAGDGRIRGWVRVERED